MNVNTTMVPAMQLALDANFGSVRQWRDDFTTQAHRLLATGGCVRLVFQPSSGRLVNQTQAADHVELLTLEVQANPALNLPAWLDGIDWAAPYAAYQHAVHDASAALVGSAADVAGAVLLDVRRAGVFAQAQHMLPGAQWRDPALVAQWAPELPQDRPVLVYCIYGHEVGRATALRLHAAGVQARFLQGGIDEWSTAGRPLQAIAKQTGDTT
jgi:superoxide dismutase, Fe-Mn family